MPTVELNGHLTASIPADRAVETPNPPTYDAEASAMEALDQTLADSQRDR